MKKFTLITFLTLSTLFAKAQQSILPSTCNELFIAAYMDGSGNDKAIALFNPSDAPINLSDYDVRIYDNGSSTISHSITFGSATIASRSQFIISNDQFNPLYVSYANLVTTDCIFNGNDAIELNYMQSPVDRIGRVGQDSLWAVDPTANTQLHTLLRKFSTTKGEINWDLARSEYDAHPSNDYTDLLAHLGAWCSSAASNDAFFDNSASFIVCEAFTNTMHIKIKTASPPSPGNTKTVSVYFQGAEPTVAAGEATLGTHFTCLNVAHPPAPTFFDVVFVGNNTPPDEAFLDIKMVNTSTVESSLRLDPQIYHSTAGTNSSLIIFRKDQTETDCSNYMNIGINNIDKNESGSISIFPIPANDAINIATENSTIKQITITNVLGEVQKNVSSNNQKKENINIQALPAGNYFITIQLENKNVVHKIFTKF